MTCGRQGPASSRFCSNELRALAMPVRLFKSESRLFFEVPFYHSPISQHDASMQGRQLSALFISMSGAGLRTRLVCSWPLAPTDATARRASAARSACSTSLIASDSFVRGIVREVWRLHGGRRAVFKTKGSKLDLFECSGFLVRSRCPHWVRSRHVQRKKSCPLYPRKRTCAVQLGMSALCQ